MSAANYPWLRIAPGHVTIQVQARPGAGRQRVVRVDERGLVIALNAAPERGKANEELLDFLASAVNVPRSSLTIAQGAGARRKLIRITTPTPEIVADKIRDMMQRAGIK